MDFNEYSRRLQLLLFYYIQQGTMSKDEANVIVTNANNQYAKDDTISNLPLYSEVAINNQIIVPTNHPSHAYFAAAKYTVS